MRPLLNVLLIALLNFPFIYAILSDDAYNVDFHHELLGLPRQETTFFYRPRKDEKATLLYTLSDLNILGALNPGTGKIIWRQTLGGENEKGFLRGIEGEDAIVSGLGSRVECWDATSGIARWGNKFPGNIRDLKVIEMSLGPEIVMNVLVLLEEDGIGVVRLLKGDTGDTIWEYRSTELDVPLQINGNVLSIFLVSSTSIGDAYNFKVSIINPINGKKSGEYTIASKTDIDSSHNIKFLGAHTPIPVIAWLDRSKKNIIVNTLTKTGPVGHKLSVKETDGRILKVNMHTPAFYSTPPQFLMHIQTEKSTRAEVYDIDLLTGSMMKLYELQGLDGSETISISYEDTNILFTKVTRNEVSIVSSTSSRVLGRWPIKAGTHGKFLHASSEVIRRSGNSFALRCAILTAHENFIMVRNGAEIWARPEGLSGAVIAEWAEIPEVESIAATLHAEAHSNFIHAYFHRVRRHINDLRYLPEYFMKISRGLISTLIPTQLTKKPVDLVKDKFGLNKLIFVATVRGSIYALESNNQGSVAWFLKAFDKSVANKWEVKGILADDIKGTLSIFGANGEFLLLNSSNGDIIERVEPGLSSMVHSTVKIENNEGKWLLPIGVHGIPDVIPLTQVPQGLLVTQSKCGQIQGVAFESADDIFPVITWTFKPEPRQRVINVVSRPDHDPVASIGRVLGDRNVLYKYLNPNLILVTTVSDHASTASFYLLDAVSGEILHSVTHENVDTKQSITSVLTENWFVYSLWSDTNLSSSGFHSKGYQIVVSELFESEVPNDRGPIGSGNFSSLSPSDNPSAEPAVPHIVSQSFLIPEPISNMVVTQTRQGITSRMLICTLAHSNAIIGIPRTLLDPRRPVGRAPTSAEAEEELFQYQPLIEFNPAMIITHEREVIGVKGVIATPALIESTSLLLAYGIDIFGTRVTPSQAFDILGKRFNKLSLIATVLILTISAGILAPIVRFFIPIRQTSAYKSKLGKKKTNKYDMEGIMII